MASKQTCREVAAVPPDRLPQRLSLFFADMACNNFDESRTPNTAPDEARVRDQLVTPLQWMLCGGDPSVSFCSLQEHQTQANFCGKVFRGGEPAYFCKSVPVVVYRGGKKEEDRGRRVGMDWNKPVCILQVLVWCPGPLFTGLCLCLLLLFHMT